MRFTSAAFTTTAASHARLPRRWRWAALAGAALGALALTGCAVQRLAVAKDLARASEPAQQRVAAPTLRVLVVGDSTAVGTGAASPAHSVAGRLAAANPAWHIVNRGADGARFRDLPAQIGPGAAAGAWDTVLVMAGGNDVLRLTGESALRRDIAATLAAAARIAPRVVLMPPGNVGHAPFFVWPATAWMSRRAARLQGIAREEALRAGAAFVALYREGEADPFAREPDRLHAADGLHPSSDGYALWLAELNRQAPLDAGPTRRPLPQMAALALATLPVGTGAVVAE
jgi:lysophospholipase L1-like esterase